MSEPILGTILGLDDFLKDISKQSKPEFDINPEEIVQDLISQVEYADDDTSIIEAVIQAEFTKENIAISYMFQVSKEDSITLVMYIGNQFIS